MKKPVVIIDYVDNIYPGINPVTRNTYERASKTLERVRQMAKDLDVVVMFQVQPTANEIEEARKERLAQEKLKADNADFDHFINTGEVLSRKGPNHG